MIDQLSDPQIKDSLETLDGWQRSDARHAIQKSFKFKTFQAAWKFMSHIAQHAEEIDHHPEWSNIYNRVDILLTTHDAKGISQRDIDMARKIEEIEEMILSK